MMTNRERWIWIAIVILIGVLYLAAGCSPLTASPATIEQEMPGLVALEQKQDALMKMTNILGNMGLLNDEKLAATKAHYDRYYLWHMAATNALAEGNLEKYREMMVRAHEELDNWKNTLRPEKPKESAPTGGSNI